MSLAPNHDWTKPFTVRYSALVYKQAKAHRNTNPNGDSVKRHRVSPGLLSHGKIKRKILSYTMHTHMRHSVMTESSASNLLHLN